MKHLLICALFFCQCAAGQSLPLKNLKINSGFGLRIHPITGEWKIHEGIDLAARHDTVYSILDGIIEKVAFDEQLGPICENSPWWRFGNRLRSPVCLSMF